jgi:iron(II)-dependent oxidoreductase
VTLPKFFINRWPATVDQFRAFVTESGRAVDPHALEGPSNAPVTLVSLHDALAYCEWLTEKLREHAKGFDTCKVMLPSEEEWEKAARGIGRRKYPWGDKADPEKSNCAATRIGEPNAVGCFPDGASPYGCEEMCGNVWEWVRSQWDREELDDFSGRLRGGSFESENVGCSHIGHADSTIRLRVFGFRVVLLPFSSDL